MNAEGVRDTDLARWHEIKASVAAKITDHLRQAPLDELIRQRALSDRGVYANLCKWMEDPYIPRFSPQTKAGILAAIADGGRWADLAEAFYTDIEFGTGGIRGRAAIQDAELEMLRDGGLQAPFLRGPNTINDVVVLQKSAAIARFGRDRGLNSVVIGYDSRIRGRDFAHLIASLFLAYEFRVFLFDDVIPYPLVTFAIPHLRADMGILISASHNDRRYNGYKLSCGNGSQFSIRDRTIILTEYVARTDFDAIRLAPLSDPDGDRLVFIGGPFRLPEAERYYSFAGEPKDIQSPHFRHVMDFLVDRGAIRAAAQDLHVAYSAYNGAGGVIVRQLVEALGVVKFDAITSLWKIDGMFPAFEDLRSPGGVRIYQQPDPGEPRAARVALQKYEEEFGAHRLRSLDVLVGTDPDADRVGLTVSVPPSHREVFGNQPFALLDADTIWSLLIWYRLQRWQELEALRRLQLTPAECFIVQSHTTTDVIPLLCRKHGLGWVKSWVGFAQLAACTEKVWNGCLAEDYFTQPPVTEDFKSVYRFEGMSPRSVYNFAALEQSNGFSILGARPESEQALGRYGHVRDKDGTFAGILFFDVLAYAKRMGVHVLDLVDEHLYLDPAIGLIRTGYRAAPQYGQYEGLEGRSRKLNILRKALELADAAGAGVSLGRRAVRRVEIYRTGKYDVEHGHTRERGFDPQRRESYWFPDEGIRYFFEDEFNHLTIRPSGTSQSLRFHVQLRKAPVDRGSLRAARLELDREITGLLDEVGVRLGVNWDE